MNVLIHTIREIGHSFIGGTERLLIETSKELALLGHQPFIVCSGRTGWSLIEGVKVLKRVPDDWKAAYKRFGFANSNFITQAIMKGDVSLSGLVRLGRYVDQQLEGIGADVVHLNSFATSLFAKAACGSIVSNYENDLEYDSKWGEGFSQFLGQSVRSGDGELHQAARLITPSQFYANFYAKHFQLPVVHLRGGVRLESFRRSLRRESFHEAIKKTPLRILIPSRFDPFQKGHDIALAACKELLSRGVVAELTFSGMRRDYEKRLSPFMLQARKAGVRKHVAVRRFSDMTSAYAACDIVASPERYCSYGLSISESLSMGVPTILSDIPTYREIANGYKHAVFFPSGDPVGFASAAQKARSISPDALEKEAVRFRINNDLREVAVRLSNLYEEVSNVSA